MNSGKLGWWTIFIVIFLAASAFIRRRFYSEKNKEPEHLYSPVFYNHNYDDEDDEDYNDSDDYDSDFYDSDEDDDIEEAPGGIPFGDGNIYMTDDNDFLDEFGDDIL